MNNLSIQALLAFAFLVLHSMAAVSEAERPRVESSCVAYPAFQQSPRLDPSQDLVAELDRLSGSASGELLLDGNVVIRFDNSTAFSPLAVIDVLGKNATFPRGVRLESESIVLQGRQASFDLQVEKARLDQAQWFIPGSALRGKASLVEQRAGGALSLNDGTLTACTPGDEGWSLSADSIRLGETDDFAVARGAVLRIRSLPILYIPYLRIPVSAEETGGLISPELSYSGSDGLDVALPYRFNLGEAGDVTLTPRLITERGVGIELDGSFQDATQAGQLTLAYLHEDDQYNGRYDLDTHRAFGGHEVLGSFESADRWLIGFDYQSRLGPVTTTIDFNRISDPDYYRDLETLAGVANPEALEQYLEIAYRSDHFSARLISHDFQKLDDLALQSYGAKPSLALSYDTAPQALGGVSLAASWTDFERSINRTLVDEVNGSRLHLQPEVRAGGRSIWGFWQTKAGLHHSEYRLRPSVRAASGVMQETSRDRRLAYGSVDVGLFFEKDLRVGPTAWLQTLEPRLYYLRQGFEDQDALPNFDSSTLTLNYDQLFRPNRFSGLDRLGDANRLTLGLTSRFLRSDTGYQSLALKLGHVVQFDDPKVVLANVPNPVGDRVWVMQQEFNRRLGGGMDGALLANQLWDYDQNAWRELAVHARLTDANRRSVNLGFRQRREDDIRQAEVAFSWPTSSSWSYLARWNYDLRRSRTLEAFAGVEFDDCCLNIRLVARQYLENPSFQPQLRFAEYVPAGYSNLRTDRAIFLEVTLKGLAGIGRRLDTLLTQGIRGYSPLAER